MLSVFKKNNSKYHFFAVTFVCYDILDYICTKKITDNIINHENPDKQKQINEARLDAVPQFQTYL